MDMLVVVIVVGVWTLLNLAATLAVVHDDDLKRRERTVQLMLVWLVPFFGGLYVMFDRWKNADRFGTDRFESRDSPVGALGDAFDGD